MELWIRSQDKTFLRKVNTIGIVEPREFWSIDENLTVSFGKYKTKERALEVLDEIQDLLKKDKFKDERFCCDKLTKAIVYEMPAE